MVWVPPTPLKNLKSKAAAAASSWLPVADHANPKSANKVSKGVKGVPYIARSQLEATQHESKGTGGFFSKLKNY